MSCCKRSNIFIAGPSATIVEDCSWRCEASLVSMNSGITSRLAMARNSACSTATKRPASMPAGGKLVVRAGHGVEDRAGSVTAEIAGRAASPACGA